MDWFESILINTQKEVLENIIRELTNIVFVETPKRQPKMNAEASREWVIDNVKPLILSDITTQSKIADKLNIKYVIVIGEEEVKNSVVTIKDMKTGEQETVSIDDVLKKLI